MTRAAKLSIVGVVLSGSIVWFGRDMLLMALGRYLTGSNGHLRSSADVVVVPAADYIRSDVRMETLEQAAGLVQDRRVTSIVMSCPELYGISECELAEKALQEKGYSAVRIRSLRTERLPDELEAGKAICYLKERGTKSAIVLLPNYKVCRLGEIYRRLGAQSGIRVAVSGLNWEFDSRRWWLSREGQKRFAEEVARLARLW